MSDERRETEQGGADEGQGAPAAPSEHQARAPSFDEAVRRVRSLTPTLVRRADFAGRTILRSASDAFTSADWSGILPPHPTSK